MVGRNRIAKNPESSGTGDFSDRSGKHAEVGEEGRLLNVRRTSVELINIAGGGRDLVPLGILLSEIRVELLKHLRFERRLHLVSDVLQRRPDVFQENFATGLIVPNRLLRKIDVNPTGERERDHQWR